MCRTVVVKSYENYFYENSEKQGQDCKDVEGYAGKVVYLITSYSILI